MTDIVVPTLGESVSEATVAKWMKKAGDAVKKDETLVELETDKVSVEVSAPEAGVLSEIVASEGATVGIGAVLGRMGGAGAQPAASAPKAEAPKPHRRHHRRHLLRPAMVRPSKRRRRFSASLRKTMSMFLAFPARAKMAG